MTIMMGKTVEKFIKISQKTKVCDTKADKIDLNRKVWAQEKTEAHKILNENLK